MEARNGATRLAHARRSQLVEDSRAGEGARSRRPGGRGRGGGAAAAGRARRPTPHAGGLPAWLHRGRAAGASGGAARARGARRQLGGTGGAGAGVRRHLRGAWIRGGAAADRRLARRRASQYLSRRQGGAASVDGEGAPLLRAASRGRDSPAGGAAARRQRVRAHVRRQRATRHPPHARRAGGCRDGDLGSGRPTRGIHLCPRAEGALRRRSLLRQVPTPAQVLDQALRIGRAANFEQYIVHAWERLLPEPRHTQPETRQRARVIGARGVRWHELVLVLRIELPELRALGLRVYHPVFGDAGPLIFIELVATVAPDALW